MYRTVIFDLDGTLLNTIDDLANAANFVCRQHAWPTYTVDEYKKKVGNGIPKLVYRFVPPRARDETTLAKALEEFIQRYSAHMQDCTAPYQGILPLLETLHKAGVQLAVLSNKQDSLAKEVVKSYFPPFFQLVRGSLPDVAPKPDAACVHRLMQELGAESSTTLFVGDSDVDMLTAKNAGLAGCGVLWGFREKAELSGAGASYLAKDPKALEAVILSGADRL